MREPPIIEGDLERAQIDERIEGLDEAQANLLRRFVLLRLKLEDFPLNKEVHMHRKIVCLLTRILPAGKHRGVRARADQREIEKPRQSL
jgi:hypothetical protein